MINVEAAPEADVFVQNGTCESPESGSITFAFDAESDASSIDLSIDGGENYTTVNVFLGIYTFGNLTEGTYSIVIRNSESGCEFELEDVVIENPLPIEVLNIEGEKEVCIGASTCLLYTSPSPRDKRQSRMPSSA